MHDATSTFARLNEPPPDFTVKTTQGDRTLSDYKHKWLILFSHPADFTPVRTTEFIGFPNAADTFKSVYCPMSNGRPMNEFVRLLQAMQTSDKNGVTTPEGWIPGGDVIVPPPKTADAADKRAGEGYKMTDWYYSTKSL